MSCIWPCPYGQVLCIGIALALRVVSSTLANPFQQLLKGLGFGTMHHVFGLALRVIQVLCIEIPLALRVVSSTLANASLIPTLVFIIAECCVLYQCCVQCSNYGPGCRGFPRHWSLLSRALLQPKPSQPGILFIPGSARLCLTTMAKAESYWVRSLNSRSAPAHRNFGPFRSAIPVPFTCSE